MNTPKVLFKKLRHDAILPTYAKPGDAGMDVYSVEDVILFKETVLISTGIAIAVPPGYFGSARERSGLALQGIRLGAGVIDSGYRGEIKCVLTNLTADPFPISKGDRIAQIIIQPYVRAVVTEVEELPASHRGDAGFGSTGR